MCCENYYQLLNYYTAEMEIIVENFFLKEAEVNQKLDSVLKGMRINSVDVKALARFQIHFMLPLELTLHHIPIRYIFLLSKLFGKGKILHLKIFWSKKQSFGWFLCFALWNVCGLTIEISHQFFLCNGKFSQKLLE